MVKVAIFFACHKRLEVLKICLDGIERLKRENKDIEFVPFAVYSGKAEGDLLEKYKVRSLKFSNEYLGHKKNAGLKELMKLDWDYMLEIGSDDIISSKLIEMYKPLWERGDNCFGVRSCYFIEPSTGRASFWSHEYAIGAGRCIKKTVFDGWGRRVKIKFTRSISGETSMPKGKEMTYTRKVADRFVNGGLAKVIEEHDEPFGLWSDQKQMALDDDSRFRLGTNGFHVQVIETGTVPMVIDIKTKDNIHAFSDFEPCNIGIGDILKDYSKEERDGIWKLR